MLQGEQAEEIVARVRAEEKDSISRPDKSMRRAPKSSSQPRRRDTLAMEVKSPSKTLLVRGGMATSQARANRLYSFKDEHVVSLFKLSQKSNRLKLPKIRCPEEVGKIDDPSYCLYHRMLGHLTKNCYIFKDVLQALIDAEVLKLHPEQKKVTANMTVSSPIQFGRNLPLVPIRVVLIPKGKLRVTISTDPHNQKEKGFIPVPTRGEIIWVHRDIVQSQQWTTVTNRKSKGKAKASSSNVVSISTREIEVDVPSLTSSGDEESAFAADIGTPPTSKTRSGKRYLKQLAS